MNAPAMPLILTGARTAPERPTVPAGLDDAPGQQQQQQAWQREMERAQLQTWFRPTAAGQSTNASGQEAAAPARRLPGNESGPNSEARMRGTRNAVAVAVFQEARAGAVNLGAYAAQATVDASAAWIPGASAPSPARPNGIAQPSTPIDEPVSNPGLRAAPLSDGAVEPAPDDATEPRPSAESDAFPPEPSTSQVQPPLRLHEESTPDGQAIWIAMQESDEALVALLPQIVTDLQRAVSLERGQRLFQVVCNGRLIWRDPPFQGDSARPDMFDSFNPKEA